jgi:hypothetical protein
MLLDTTPDTFGYMLAGYVVFFTLPLLFLLRLWLRQRNIKRDLEMMEELKRDK